MNDITRTRRNDWEFTSTLSEETDAPCCGNFRTAGPDMDVFLLLLLWFLFLGNQYKLY